MNFDSQLTIRTPEGVTFSHRLADPLARFLAWLLDFFGMLFVGFVVSRLGSLVGMISVDAARAYWVMVFFLVPICYGTLFEWFWRGQTPGKRVVRLRVLDVDGLRLQFHQILLRNLLRSVDSLPFAYLIGGLAMVFSRHSQRLGDLVAGTVVVQLVRHEEPNVDQILAGKFNSLRKSPHLAARLRQHVGATEAQLALRALLRRENYEPEARVALFHDLAEYFRSLVRFPEDDVELLSDEQYVRNVADIVFRNKPEEKYAVSKPTIPSDEPALV